MGEYTTNRVWNFLHKKVLEERGEEKQEAYLENKEAKSITCAPS
jgi:hypothetical protein